MRQLHCLACVALLLLAPHLASGQDIDELSLESLLDAPVSAAAQYEQTAREAPAAVTVISAEEIKDFGYRTLAEVLQNVRGFYLQDDLEQQYVGTRGFGRPGDFNTQVMVLVDGQAQNEASSGYIFLDERQTLNLDLVERVEVVRGPGSTLYGSGAMLAVINVVTRSAATGAGETSARAYSSSSGLNTAQLQATRGFESGLNVQFWGAGGSRPQEPSGAILGGVDPGQAWKDYYQLQAKAEYSGLAAQYRRMNYRHGSPAARFGRVFNADSTSTSYDYTTLEAAYGKDLSAAARLEFVGSYNFAERRMNFPFMAPQMELMNRDIGTSTWYRGEAKLRLDTSPANRLIVGGGFKTAQLDYVLWISGTEITREVLGFHSFSLFAQNEYRITRQLAATAGLRLDHYQKTGAALAPRLAVVFNASPQSTVKLLYGSAFRAPNVQEFSASSEHLNWVKNPDIAPEYIDTFEAVWEHEWTAGLASSISLYDYRLRGLIELGVTDDLAALQYQNLGSAAARGVEVGLSGRTGNTRFYASGAYQHARSGDGARLWSSPALLGKAGFVTSRILPGRWGLQFRGESDRKAARTGYLPGYVVSDFNFTSKPMVGGLRLGLRIQNLLDTEYSFPGTIAHVEQALPQPGRWTTIRLSYDL